MGVIDDYPWNQDMDPEPIEHENEPHEFDIVEKLAVAQAFYNAVGKMVSTKDPDNLRGQANAYYEDLFRKAGAKSFDVNLLGYKVGTFSVTVSKPKPSKQTNYIEVEDEWAFEMWAEDNGCIRKVYDMEAVSQYFEDTGEIPPGCRVETVVTPAERGGEVSRTTLRIDNEAVLDALGPRIEAVSMMLLEGGE